MLIKTLMVVSSAVSIEALIFVLKAAVEYLQILVSCALKIGSAALLIVG